MNAICRHLNRTTDAFKITRVFFLKKKNIYIYIYFFFWSISFFGHAHPFLFSHFLAIDSWTLSFFELIFMEYFARFSIYEAHCFFFADFGVWSYFPLNFPRRNIFEVMKGTFSKLWKNLELVPRGSSLTYGNSINLWKFQSIPPASVVFVYPA